jgi:hypothetical protein
MQAQRIKASTSTIACAKRLRRLLRQLWPTPALDQPVLVATTNFAA